MNQARDAPGYAIIFSIYEGVLHYFRDYREGIARLLVQILAGGIGGVMMWAILYPVDLMKTKMQTSEK